MNIASLLQDYKEQPTVKAAMLELLQTTEKSYERSTFQPGHFTASALVLSPDATELLLIYHQKLQCWLQPGGHIELTDSNGLAAAKREVLEECGIQEFSVTPQVLFDLDIHTIPQNSREPQHQHFDLRFLLQATSKEIIVGDGVSQSAWVDFKEIINGDYDFSLKRVVKKILALNF